MDLKQKPNLSLIELTDYCIKKGYYLHPINDVNGVRCVVFKDDVFVKEGKKVFKTWFDCQLENYNKIYQIY